jgi:hypothetical protein
VDHEHVDRSELREGNARVNDPSPQRNAAPERLRIPGAVHGERERRRRVHARGEDGHPRQKRAADPACVRGADDLPVRVARQAREHRREQLGRSDLLKADDIGVALAQHPRDPVDLRGQRVLARRHRRRRGAGRPPDVRREQVLHVERRERERHVVRLVA